MHILRGFGLQLADGGHSLEIGVKTQMLFGLESSFSTSLLINFSNRTMYMTLNIYCHSLISNLFFFKQVMDISMREVDKRIERKEMWERGLLTESDYDEELDDYHGVWDYVHGRKNPNDYKRFYMTDFKE